MLSFSIRNDFTFEYQAEYGNENFQSGQPNQNQVNPRPEKPRPKFIHKLSVAAIFFLGFVLIAACLQTHKHYVYPNCHSTSGPDPVLDRGSCKYTY